MAREKKEFGFDPSSIVKTDQIKQQEIKDKIDKKNVIKKIQGETEDKERIFVYLSSDLVFKVKEYGKQIGRTAGGNSRIVAEALKEYFKRHNL